MNNLASKAFHLSTCPGPESLFETPSMLRRAAILLVLAVAHATTAGDDWPHWRGPNRNGISTERLPENLRKPLPALWKAEVGVGFSSFSVVGNRTLTMGHAGGRDTVWCLDIQTGKTLWKHSYECELHPRFYEGGPGGTPTIHEESVFTLSKRGHAFRFDLETGDVIWSRDLLADHGLELPEWNFACSPFIDEELVLLNAGGGGMALSRETGGTVWLSDSNPSGYATPVAFEAPGTTHLLHTHRALIGFDSRSGKEAWRFEGLSGLNAADPVVDGRRFFLSTKAGTICLELDRDGKPIEVWKQRNLRWYFNAGVLIDGHLYSLSGTTHRPTQLLCSDAKTGESVWSEEGFRTGGLIAASGQVILLDQGKLTIFAASPEGFSPRLQQQVLGGKCWTAPVLANGRIFCRNAEGSVVALGVAQPAR